jgi:hypothetical protein
MERKNFITKSRPTQDDINLVEIMFCQGYKLTHIVPIVFPDGSCSGYTYWFESLELIK